MSLADLPPTALEQAANIFELLLLGVGAILLVKQSQREWNRRPEPLPSWPAPWSHFALWLGLIIFTALAGEVLLGAFFEKIYPIDFNAPLSPTDTLVLGGAQQALILLAQLGILCSGRNHSPAPLNRENLPLPKIFAKGALAFAAAYPVIIIASFGWRFLLEKVQHLFPKMETPAQAVVHFISNKPDLGIISLTVLFAVALAPVNEELLFRAGLYRFLKGKFPRWVALTVASFLFATAHFNLLSFVPLFVVGWLLARTYERTGHIGTCMVFHALFNLNSIVMSLVFPNQS